MYKITRIELKSLAILKAQLTAIAYLLTQAIAIPTAFYLYGFTLGTATTILINIAIALPLTILFAMAITLIVALLYNTGLLYQINGEVA